MIGAGPPGFRIGLYVRSREEIAAAWAVKELLRQLLAGRDRHTIAHRLHRFYQAVSLVEVPEATRLAETIDA